MSSHQYTRNFSIIAHIDHGKSTLADRFIEMAGLMDDRTKKNQVLDSLDIERERGITVKAQTVRIQYRSKKDSKLYDLNLIDTPGHVDFSYEVSRALMACESVLLIVDASQGIEAQTLAHFYSAIAQNLTIIPVINKIDLPTANVENVKDQIENDLAIERERTIGISAKTGLGVENLLEAIVDQCPAPEGRVDLPLKVLVYDAYYDDYRGVVTLIRVFEGTIKKGDSVRFFQTNHECIVEEVGFFKLTRTPCESLQAGEVGYMIGSIKNLEQVKIGDTITHVDNPTKEALPGFKDVKSFVFASIFPIDPAQYQKLKESLKRLRLNDSSLSFEPENSQALGAGFRCGFLGLLHFEIIQERLQREFGLDIVVSAPGVEYKLILTDKKEIWIASPSLYPNTTRIEKVFEPYVKMTIYTPQEYLGNVLNLCQEKRGLQENMDYMDANRIELTYKMPLAEIIYDFHDKLKSLSRGYATFDYELTDHQPTNIVKVDVLVNGKQVDALSFLCFTDNAHARGKMVVERLKDSISRHMFQIPIQAAIGSKVIARETLSALKKDVTAKCYGGDISRKKKLLSKQKEGKKRMQVVGNVEIPQEAFINVFKGDMDKNS